MAVKIYTVYPWNGSYTTRSAAYSYGSRTLLRVAAQSAAQAVTLARKGVWVTDPERPLGIVENYVAESGKSGERGDHRFFCGCTAFMGGLVGHGWGTRKTVEALRAHQCIRTNRNFPGTA